MTRTTLRRLMFSVLLSLVSSQAVTQSGSGSLVSLSTEASCGVGNAACPTESVGSNDLTVTTDASVPLPQDSTVSALPQEITTLTTETLSSLVTETTPKSTKASTTTSSPSAISKNTQKQSEEKAVGYAQSGTCACDLTAQSCDINCCCDPECSPVQHAAFSLCKMDGYPPYDNRYCYSSKLIFLNNSEHLLQQSQNGVFCIVRSNLAGSVLYTAHTIFPSHQEFIKHWDRSHPPAWPDPFEPKVLVVDKPRLYSAGASLWVLFNNLIQPLYLPSSGLTSACSKMKSVQYLLPWSSQCVRKAPQAESECKEVTAFLYNQIQNIVKSPLLVNQTKLLSGEIERCTPRICAPVAYFICPSASASVNGCKNVSQKLIFEGFRKGVCHSIVKKLRLSFFHNGTVGIDHVRAYLWLVNSTLDASLKNPMYQSVAVDFNWLVLNKAAKVEMDEKSATNVTTGMHRNYELPLARSGNPGYILGKPVISGLRVKPKITANSSRDSVKEKKLTKHDMIKLSHDPMEWITLPTSDSNGKCSWSEEQRHVVTFGEDLHMSCKVVISPTNISSLHACNALKSKLLHLLMGYVPKIHQNNTSQNDWGRVVAAFGSANVSALQDWIPFLIDYQPSFPLWSEASISFNANMLEDPALLSTDSLSQTQTCESVPLGIQIQFMHGFVGTAASPQSKILGAFMRFSPLQDIGLSCDGETCFQAKETMHLRVVSTVRFLDISSPAVTRFAEPPAIHIRLPPDFFYPFMATEGSSSFSVHGESWLVIFTGSAHVLLMFFLPFVCV